MVCGGSARGGSFRPGGYWKRTVGVSPGPILWKRIGMRSLVWGRDRSGSPVSCGTDDFDSARVLVLVTTASAMELAAVMCSFCTKGLFVSNCFFSSQLRLRGKV